MSNLSVPAVQKEIERRRTFAIISHPDAGKTTLTEKLLFHGGVIHETGEVKGKSGTKAVTSDWMELEPQKGIQITSSGMTFAYNQQRIHLLEGHVKRQHHERQELVGQARHDRQGRSQDVEGPGHDPETGTPHCEG